MASRNPEYRPGDALKALMMDMRRAEAAERRMRRALDVMARRYVEFGRKLTVSSYSKFTKAAQGASLLAGSLSWRLLNISKSRFQTRA